MIREPIVIVSETNGIACIEIADERTQCFLFYKKNIKSQLQKRHVAHVHKLFTESKQKLSKSFWLLLSLKQAIAANTESNRIEQIMCNVLVLNTFFISYQALIGQLSNQSVPMISYSFGGRIA